MEHIPHDKFRRAERPQKLLDTAGPRAPGYFLDAARRFAQNRSSLVALVLIGLLLIFAIAAPMFSPYDVSFRDGYYKQVLPKWKPLAFLGWDGCASVSGSQGVYDYYSGIGEEYGSSAVKSVTNQTVDPYTGRRYYEMEVDSYEKVGFLYVDLSPAQYAALRAYEKSSGRQVCYPISRYHETTFIAVSSGANLWYALTDESAASNGESAYHDENGQPVFQPAYLLDALGQPVYAVRNQTGYRVRVRYEEYYIWQNGFAPNHPFGTNQHGQDIFVCLAQGARLSFLLAFSVSAINLLIGVLYGAIEGYYGGKWDLIMERIADILAAVPFIVVATLFQLHLAKRAGPVLSLLFAFVLTGWIGIASRVRAQFYRYKRAEYVLSARTLGAKDRRLVFRHILPNAIGTIITGTILIIPGVIFSESMLSYLGIVNLEASGFTSIGTMLSGGRAYLGSFPHILLFPAVFIALLEICFNLFGNGLRDAFNPHLRGE